MTTSGLSHFVFRHGIDQKKRCASFKIELSEHPEYKVLPGPLMAPLISRLCLKGSDLLFLNAFRWLGRLEGSSFLILVLIAMPLKYIFGQPEAVRVVGMAHGVLFLVYILAANYVAMQLNWSKKVWFLSYVAAVLPLGTFVFEKHHLPKH